MRSGDILSPIRSVRVIQRFKKKSGNYWEQEGMQSLHNVTTHSYVTVNARSPVKIRLVKLLYPENVYLFNFILL